MVTFTAVFYPLTYAGLSRRIILLDCACGHHPQDLLSFSSILLDPPRSLHLSLSGVPSSALLHLSESLAILVCGPSSSSPSEDSGPFSERGRVAVTNQRSLSGYFRVHESGRLMSLGASSKATSN